MISLVLAGACVDAGDTEPLPIAGGLDAFLELAQPVLAARCANPSCHGNADRPLAVYAVHRHRMDPRDVYVDTPLSDEELRHNFVQASVFLLGVRDASQCPLLTRPLAVEAGGSGHASVAIFAGTADYDYQRLHAWIEATLDEGGSP